MTAQAFARVVSVCLLAACPLVAGPLLEQSLDEAIGQARDEGKHVYIAFIGEDWSLSSKRFKESILDSTAFRAFTEKELVYFPVETRRKPPMTKEETAVLQALVIHFDVKSYPTIIILGPDGGEVLRHTFKDMEPPAYVALLETILP